MGFSTSTCTEFVEVLASKAPVPGGGGASALVGAVGTALGNMVGSLTVGKKKYADVEDEMYELKAKCDQLQKDFLRLIERDAEVFEPLSKAYGMPKETEEEKAEKARVMEIVLKDACSVPMEIMEKCCEAIELIVEFGAKGSKLAISDAGVGAAFCKAALQGASLNVYINTKSMANREYAEELNKKADAMLEKYTKTIQENMQKEGKYDENRDLWENGVQLVTANIQNKMLQLLYNENRQSALIYSDMQHITRNMIIISLFLAAFLVVVTTMMITIIPRSISKPVRYLSSITKEVADGNLEVRAHMEHGVDVKLLADSLNVMIEKIKTLIDNVMLEQMRLREAELEILQMQINPHFLYNTLDTIVWLAEAGQKEQVVSMVQTLSDFFRASLNSGKDIVSLEGECRHITSYLQIQQVRYQDILTYDVDIPEEIANCKIPKITLQPLVENALYHGIKNKRGKGRIVVTGRREKDKCVIRVEDNGIGMTKERLNQVRGGLTTKIEDSNDFYGLYNVNERIRLKFGEEYGLSIDSVLQEGTCVEVWLPWES